MHWRLCLLLLLLTSGLRAEQPAPCTLRMSAETDFPPHLIKQNQQWGGLSVELMQKLAAKVGCELEFINSPWLRAIQQSEAGELDVLSHLSFTAQRQQHFAFIGPHHIEAIYLIGEPNRLPQLHNLTELTETIDLGRIAALHGAYYGEQFSQLMQSPHFARQLVNISSIQDKLALLRANRVNAILEDISVLQYWQLHGYPQAEQYQPLLKIYESPVYFGFSKTSLTPERLAELANAWLLLHQQGELTPIYQKYQINNAAQLMPSPKL